MKVVAGDDVPDAYMDSSRITQVLTNLLSNALKFTPPGGQIDVILANDPDGRFVRVSVKDTGRGIDKNHTEKIFNSHYQIKAEDGTTHKGLGLGLSISRDLVELHGGKISVESTLGVGSTFAFTIPSGEGARVG